MHRRAVIWLTLMAVGIPSGLPGQRPAGPQELSRRLDAVVRQGMRDWGIPGLSIAVVRNDSVLLRRGYGTRALRDTSLVDEHTLFGIMSTTKAMTATALAMLVDDGVVQWEDPVTRWVPEFEMPEPYVTRALTVLDLLTHRAGLGNADLLWLRGDLTAAEIFRRVRDLEPAYSLRAGFVYQNVMYGLAGEVIARASGMPYGEFLRRRLFEPLGMRRTFATWADVTAAGVGNVSRAHYAIRDTIRVIPEDTVDVIPAAGAVWSTASDMARWMRFLLDSGRVAGRPLVRQAGIQMLLRPQTTIPADEFYPTARLTRPHWMTYGLGWFQQDYRGRFVAFHTGSLDGRTAIVGLLPDERFGVVVFGNLDHAEFRHAVMLTAFDLQIGGPRRDWNAELLELYGDLRARRDSVRAARDAGRIAGTTPSLPLSAYAGTYRHAVWGDLVVTARGETLAVRLGTSSELAGPLRHWHHDTFRIQWGDGRAEPGWLRFAFGLDGAVTEARLGVDDEAGFLRVP